MIEGKQLADVLLARSRARKSQCGNVAGHILAAIIIASVVLAGAISAAWAMAKVPDGYTPVPLTCPASTALPSQTVIGVEPALGRSARPFATTGPSRRETYQRQKTGEGQAFETAEEAERWIAMCGFRTRSYGFNIDDAFLEEVVFSLITSAINRLRDDP
jgi:hypothetical protein